MFFILRQFLSKTLSLIYVKVAISHRWRAVGVIITKGATFQVSGTHLNCFGSDNYWRLATGSAELAAFDDTLLTLATLGACVVSSGVS